MTSFYSTVYNGLISASVVLFLIGLFSSGEVSMGSYITGYSTLILGIMLLLVTLFNKLFSTNQNMSSSEMVYAILSMTGPFILMLGTISFVLYLMITYKSIIIDDHVSPGYYSFNNITVLLILFQLYIVFTNTITPDYEKTHKLSKLTSSIIYLIGTLSIISSIIMYTILKYFTTDGFTAETDISEYTPKTSYKI
tara:strand:+ start:157 stop:741 length:585 start_codon:yes stop_codon:yes gene_type:complete